MFEELWHDCRNGAIGYVKSLQGEKLWQFKVSHTATENIAIASASAVLLLNFLDGLNDIPDAAKKQWVEYLQSFQQDDGLFEDKIDMAEETQGYPYWALRAHRSRHIAWAIEALGGRLQKPITFVEPYTEKGYVKDWVDKLWQESAERIWSIGNWIMDMGVLLDLQYRHFGDENAARSVHEMLDALNEKQDPKTGYWIVEGVDPRCAMAGAMHFYPLYWAYGHRLNYLERAVEETLALQQPDGLFGFEAGTGGCQCLDYDAILILANGYYLGGEKQKKIKRACQKVLDAIMINHNDDGSFADSQIDEVRYWTTKAAAYKANGGSLWDTYARMMTIAMCIEIVCGHSPESMTCEHHIFEIFHKGKGWKNGQYR